MILSQDPKKHKSLKISDKFTKKNVLWFCDFIFTFFAIFANAPEYINPSCHLALMKFCKA